MRKPKVLVACEFTGTVRDAFTAHGCYAVSCDLIKTERPGRHHQGSVLDIIGDGWDIMVGHPPCKYLSFAGMANWNDEGRAELREEAMQFFYQLWNAPIRHIALENPRGYPCKVFRKPDQVIHPYYFGDREMKRTCLWLKNLPRLEHHPVTTLFDIATHTPKPQPTYTRSNGKAIYFTDAKKGGKARSRFFPGIAAAMAAQWTNHILSLNHIIQV